MSDLMQAPQENDLTSLGEVSDSSNKSRVIMLLAVAAGVVVLGLAAFFLFFSGGSDDEALAPVPKGQPTQQHNGNGKGGKQDQPNKVPPVYQGDVGRDPFKALPAEAIAARPTPSPSATATSGTQTDTGTALSPDYYQVSVASIGANQAKVVLNGVAYPVKPGQRFPDATNGPFQLVRIASNQKSVTLNFGSEKLTIGLREGYTIEL